MDDKALKTPLSKIFPVDSSNLIFIWIYVKLTKGSVYCTSIMWFFANKLMTKNARKSKPEIMSLKYFSA